MTPTYARFRNLTAMLLIGLAASAAMAQEGRVELEIVTEPGLSPETGREWLAALRGIDVEGLRIRQARSGDLPAVRTTGSGASASYRVLGYLGSDNKLRVPGAAFGIDDRAKLNRWVRKLKEGGEEGLSAKPLAFGLSEKQLVDVHEALAAKVATSIKGKSPREAVEAIERGLLLKVQVDGTASRSLDSAAPVSAELEGLSSGTALAAVLRPAGLVMVPTKVGGGVALNIVDRRSAKEHWPVGWPLKEAPKDVLPDLYKFLNVEVKDTPVGEAAEAVRSRLKVPMIVDQAALAQQKIDFETTKVSLPKTNTFYGKILERLLYAAKLKYELRTDEADQPFLWITTLRQ